MIASMIGMDVLLWPVTITLSLGGIIAFFLYWSSVRNFSYWKKRGIPQTNTIPVLGSAHEIFGNFFHKLEEDRYKKFGRLYGHYEGSSPLLSVAEPALLRDILVKDFGYFHDRRAFDSGIKSLDLTLASVHGDDWKRIRSIVSPTFSTGKIKRMLNIFKESSRILDENIRTAGKDGKYVEVKRLYEAFTLDVIASAAFSTKINSLNDPENRFVQMAKRTFNVGMSWRFIFFLVAPRLMKFLRLTVFEAEPMEFFSDVTLQIVEDRKKSGKSRNDFLQLLMDTAKEVSKEEKWDTEEKDDILSNYGENEIEKQILKTVISKNLSMDELVAQCVIFFLAGYHTTAATLSFATYNLALHPDIQDKLRKEVDDILKENHGVMTYEAVQSMKYLDNVISETLRMYPPSTRLERICTAEYELGDTGITLPKGMVLTIPVYAIHRDPDFYPQPEKFDPDRFLPEERGIRDQYTYLPFGAGPRNCVGMRFALMEIKVCLAYVVANFNIKKCPETKVPLEFAFGEGILKAKDTTLEMEPRKNCPLVK